MKQGKTIQGYRVAPGRSHALRLCWPMVTLVMTALVMNVSTTSTTTTTTCPRACTCRGEDSTQVDCSAQTLVSPPVTSASTVTLDLSHNALGPIINASFPRMSNLTSLDLSYNALTRLLGCTLSGLLALKRVALRGNRLTDLPDSLFTDANTVEELDISYNLFSELPDAAFRNLAQLKLLDVSHNSITTLKLGPRFQVPRHIESIDFSYNMLGNITLDAFEIATNWEIGIDRSLSLAFCQISSIDEGSFSKISNLRSLDLSGNEELTMENLTTVVRELEDRGLQRLSLARTNLTTIVPLFQNVQRLALKHLNVSFNQIQTIPARVFSTLHSLRQLDLSHNLINTLDAGFTDLVNLRVLNISHNGLQSFQGPAVGSMSKLRVLDVSDNRLNTANGVNFSSLNKLFSLDAHNNLMSFVALPTNTSRLKHIDVHANSIASFSGVNDATNLQTFDISDNDLESVQPFLFKQAKSLKLVNFSMNSIITLDHRAFQPQSPLVLDLSHNFLREIRYSNWAATQRLFLNHNHLTEIDFQVFYGMSGLDYLDLSENKISSLHEDLLQFVTNLKHLNLSHNQIATSMEFSLLRNLALLETLDLGYNNISQLNHSTLVPVPKIRFLSLRDNRFQTLTPRVFRDLEHIHLLDLSNNPFSCECDMLAFRDWIRRTTIPIRGLYTPNSSAYVCHSPAHRLHSLVSDWDPGQFECDESMLYMIIFGSIGLFLIVAGVLGTAAFRLYKHRKANGPLLGHKGGEGERGKRTQKIDLSLLTKEEIVEEIKEAIERKEQRLQGKDRQVGRDNGYVSFPRGHAKGQERPSGKNRAETEKDTECHTRQRQDSRSGKAQLKKVGRDGREEKIGSVHNVEPAREGCDVYTDDPRGNEMREREEEKRVIEEREPRQGSSRHDTRGQRIEEGRRGRREHESKDSHDVKHHERQHNKVVLVRPKTHEGRHSGRVRGQLDGQWYRSHGKNLGQRHGRNSPYIISTSRATPASRWDDVDIWDGPRGWTLQGQGQYRGRDIEGEGYFTLPAMARDHRRIEHRDARSLARVHDNFLVRNNQRGIRFDERHRLEGNYARLEDDDRYHRQSINRSHSHQQLPSGYDQLPAVYAKDRLQREYESIDRVCGPPGPKSASQPYLANVQPSGWL